MNSLYIKPIKIYLTREGKCPFTNWLVGLKDSRTRQRIHARIDRLALGNPGDHKGVGLGVYELRCHFGAGYRIYYGEAQGRVILLLCGGDKSTQRTDIKLAQQYFVDYMGEKTYAKVH